jgi:hypothetical protein
METTKKDVLKEFSAIRKQAKKVKTLAVKPKAENEYFTEQNTLKAMIRDFLRTEFTLLPKESFFELSDLVSSHRPVEPFSFLVSVSLRKKVK